MSAAASLNRIATLLPHGVGARESKFKKRRRGNKGRKPWRARRKPPPNTHAPYNNNQFLMEEHAPDAQDYLRPRTRDSSFSVDSDEYYPLPEDEEDFLAKEFSSMYEDAQSERLMSMSKQELLHEYLALQSRYEAVARVPLPDDTLNRLREQEVVIEELREELRQANQALAMQMNRMKGAREASSSSVDSESDSSSSSTSSLSPPPTSPAINGYDNVRTPEPIGGEQSENR